MTLTGPAWADQRGQNWWQEWWNGWQGQHEWGQRGWQNGNSPAAAPEIDPGLAGATVGIVISGLLILSDRRRRPRA